MLPTQLLWLCNPVAHAFQVPALRKGAGDTRFVFGPSEIKSLGHTPQLCPAIDAPLKPKDRMTPEEEVPTIFSHPYPELATAVITGSEAAGEQLQYSFARAIGTKA